MRAIHITDLTGPEHALQLVEVPEPRVSDAAADTVVVDVRAAGVSFPELLQTRGMYQNKPTLPFIPGSEVAGVVRSAPASSPLRPGDRVSALCGLGGFAEVVAAPEHMVCPLPDQLDFDQGAALILNYHTAWFALVLRGQLRPDETVLVHGAAGGVGTAMLQVAKGCGARTIAVVSSDEKESVAREAGADHVVRSDGAWKDEVRSIADGGIDLVMDPVGGERFLDSLRVLRETGRLVVVGFAGGSIPEVKVNRLLLGNVSVVGAGWGAYVMSKPSVTREITAHIASLIETGAVSPLVGAAFPLERASEALQLLDNRSAVGKVVLHVRG